MPYKQQVMSNHEIPVAYPPAMGRQTPPVGYPTMDAATPQDSQKPVHTQSRGDDFWKGCCAAICCCCVLDACF